MPFENLCPARHGSDFYFCFCSTTPAPLNISMCKCCHDTVCVPYVPVWKYPRTYGILVILFWFFVSRYTFTFGIHVDGVTHGAVYSVLSREFKKQMFFVYDPSKNIRIPRMFTRIRFRKRCPVSLPGGTMRRVWKYARGVGRQTDKREGPEIPTDHVLCACKREF